jgi:hypothetical protein
METAWDYVFHLNKESRLKTNITYLGLCITLISVSYVKHVTSSVKRSFAWEADNLRL